MVILKVAKNNTFKINLFNFSLNIIPRQNSPNTFFKELRIKNVLKNQRD